MALFRRLFYRKPPDRLLEISERVYVFDCCFSTEVLKEDEYKTYMNGIVAQLQDHYPDAAFMVFNFKEGEKRSQLSDILSHYDMTVMDYPRQYEGCPLLPLEMVHHFLRSSDSWLSLEGQQNVLLMHCERGGWPMLAFMLSGLLLYRKQYTGEQKTLDMLYKQAPRDLLHLLYNLNPYPSQLRYLQYIGRRNCSPEWPPSDTPLALDCVIIRALPGRRSMPVVHVYGQDSSLKTSTRSSKLLFSSSRERPNRLIQQEEPHLIKIDIQCHVRGDVVLECVHLEDDLVHECMIFRIMFHTAFVQSNSLLLTRDDVDILWDAKEQFSRDFKVEVLFSDADSLQPVIAAEDTASEAESASPDEFFEAEEIFTNLGDSQDGNYQEVALKDASERNSFKDCASDRETHKFNQKKLGSDNIIPNGDNPLYLAFPVSLNGRIHGKLGEGENKSDKGLLYVAKKLPDSTSKTSVDAVGGTEKSKQQELARQANSNVVSRWIPSNKGSYTNSMHVYHPPSRQNSAPAALDLENDGLLSETTAIVDRNLAVGLPDKSSLALSPPHDAYKLQKHTPTPTPTPTPPPLSPPPPPPPPPPPTSTSLQNPGRVLARIAPPLPPPRISALLPSSPSPRGAPPPPPPPPEPPLPRAPPPPPIREAPPPPPPPRGQTPGPPPPPEPPRPSLGGPPPPPLLSIKGASSDGKALPSGRGRGSSRLGLSTTAPRRSTLKPLHWSKVTRIVQGSLWEEMQKFGEPIMAPEFDVSELESLFSATVPKSDSAGGKFGSRRNSTGSKPDRVHLIDLRRANNTEIMLTKVKMPLPDMMAAALALDESILDADQVENLIKFCPTKEEMELLKAYTGDKKILGKCEQFFLELMKVPRIDSKLRVFLFKIQFNSQVSDFRISLSTVNSVCGEVRKSYKLKEIMKKILYLGNMLNQGTARGSALGFKLDSLMKLTDTRATNSKITLMHYLCKVLASRAPDLLDFHRDLISLELASKIQLKSLAEEMQAIIKGLEKVKQELAASVNDGPVSYTFCKTLKEFLGIAETEVSSVTNLYLTAGRNADALAQYFGEDPARCPFEQVTSTLFNFVRTFQKAHEENCKHAELEKKKAQKEAEMENSKVAHLRKASKAACSKEIPATFVR